MSAEVQTLETRTLLSGDGMGATGEIGDRVWLDENGDGEFGAEESGARVPGGMTINLIDAGSDQVIGGGDDTQTATTQTNKWGAFHFEDVAPGCYYIEFILPDGYEFTQQNESVNWKKNSDADPATGFSTVFNLTPGKVDFTRDAGLIATVGTIGDRVWVDDNGDGELDGNEQGLRIPGGMTVNLFNAGDDEAVGGDDDVQVATTQTNKWGVYKFEGVEAGRYFVEFVKPDAYDFTIQNSNVNWKKNSDADPATGFTSVFNLAAGKTDLSRDAGVIDPTQNVPPVINDQIFSIREYSLGGTTVGNVIAMDANAGQTLTYEITAGNTNNAFAIDASTGELTVNNPPALNFDQTPTFNLTVQVTDDAPAPLSDDATITVNLIDAEPGDIIEDVFDLGTLDAGMIQFSEELGFGDPIDRNDLWRFQLAADSMLEMTFDNFTLDDEDFEFFVYQDFDGDGTVLDETAIDTIRRQASATEVTFRADLSAFDGDTGTDAIYYIRAFSSRSDYQTAYDGKITVTPFGDGTSPGNTTDTAQDLGQLIAGDPAVSFSDITQFTNKDVYEFTIDTDATLTATFDTFDPSSDEDLWFGIYLDSDGDGALDDELAIDGVFRFSGEADRTFTADLSSIDPETELAQTYYLYVFANDRTDNSTYTGSLSLTAFGDGNSPGNSIATAQDLGQLIAGDPATTFSDIVQYNGGDVYQFTLDTDATLTATFDGFDASDEDLNFRVLVDTDADGSLTDETAIEFLQRASSQTTIELSADLSAINPDTETSQIYYLWVNALGYDDSSTYMGSLSAVAFGDVDSPGNTPATAQDLGQLIAGDPAVTFSDIVQFNGGDVYQFTLDTDATLTASFDTFDVSDEDLNFGVYVDTDNDGSLTDETAIDFSTRFLSQATSEFTADLSAIDPDTETPQVYYLWVNPSGFDDSSTYAASLSTVAFGDIDSPGNAPATAQDLGQLIAGDPAVTFSDVTQYNGGDVYQFTLDTDATLTASFDMLDASDEDLNFGIYVDTDGDGSLTDESAIEFASRFLSQATIEFTADLSAINPETQTPQIYYLWVDAIGFDDSSTYAGSLSTVAFGDVNSPGNAPASAQSLGQLVSGGSAVTFNDIVQYNGGDVYSFTINADATDEDLHFGIYVDSDGDGSISDEPALESIFRFSSEATRTLTVDLTALNPDTTLPQTYYLWVSAVGFDDSSTYAASLTLG